jgi:hypothetical protein
MQWVTAVEDYEGKACGYTVAGVWTMRPDGANFTFTVTFITSEFPQSIVSYSNTSKHFDLNRLETTSSKAMHPILPNIALVVLERLSLLAQVSI